MGSVKYGSRKFVISMLLVIVTAALAYFDKMSAHVAMVFAAIGVMYPYAQGKIDERYGDANQSDG